MIPRIPEPLENLIDEKRRKYWIEHKNAMIYTVLSKNGMLQVDIFLTYPIDFNDLKKNADDFMIDGYNISVSSKADLIKAKESIIPLRQKDKEDIKKLKELIKNGY